MEMKYLSTEKEFRDALAEAGSSPVIVKFTAKWCGPCKRIQPLFEELAKEYQSAKCYLVDADENDDVSERYNVQSLPTFIYFKDGLKVERMAGADEEKLKAFIKNHCGPPSTEPPSDD